MFTKILVAYDGTGPAFEALVQAVGITALFKALVHVVAVSHRSVAEEMAEGLYATGSYPINRAAMEASADAAAAMFKAHNSSVQTHILISDRPYEAIKDLAVDIGADLIILGHRRQGTLSRLWNGSVGEELLAGAPCSIFIAIGKADLASA